MDGAVAILRLCERNTSECLSTCGGLVECRRPFPPSPDPDAFLCPGCRCVRFCSAECQARAADEGCHGALCPFMASERQAADFYVQFDEDKDAKIPSNLAVAKRVLEQGTVADVLRVLLGVRKMNPVPQELKLSAWFALRFGGTVAYLAAYMVKSTEAQCLSLQLENAPERILTFAVTTSLQLMECFRGRRTASPLFQCADAAALIVLRALLKALHRYKARKLVPASATTPFTAGQRRQLLPLFVNALGIIRVSDNLTKIHLGFFDLCFRDLCFRDPDAVLLGDLAGVLLGDLAGMRRAGDVSELAITLATEYVARSAALAEAILATPGALGIVLGTTPPAVALAHALVNAVPTRRLQLLLPCFLEGGSPDDAVVSFVIDALVKIEDVNAQVGGEALVPQCIAFIDAFMDRHDNGKALKESALIIVKAFASLTASRSSGSALCDQMIPAMKRVFLAYGNDDAMSTLFIVAMCASDGGAFELIGGGDGAANAAFVAAMRVSMAVDHKATMNLLASLVQHGNVARALAPFRAPLTAGGRGWEPRPGYSYLEVSHALAPDPDRPPFFACAGTDAHERIKRESNGCITADLSAVLTALRSAATTGDDLAALSAVRAALWEARGALMFIASQLELNNYWAYLLVGSGSEALHAVARGACVELEVLATDCQAYGAAGAVDLVYPIGHVLFVLSACLKKQFTDGATMGAVMWKKDGSNPDLFFEGVTHLVNALVSMGKLACIACSDLFVQRNRNFPEDAAVVESERVVPPADRLLWAADYEWEMAKSFRRLVRAVDSMRLPSKNVVAFLNSWMDKLGARQVARAAGEDCAFERACFF